MQIVLRFIAFSEIFPLCSPIFSPLAQIVYGLICCITAARGLLPAFPAYRKRGPPRAMWTACRKIDSEIKHPPVVELRKSKLQQEGRFMSRPYTHVQGLLPSVLAMKEEGYTYRQIANQFGLTKEQVEELCSRARRKQRRIEKGYIPQPKGRPRKTPATQEQLQNNRIVELEMKVELLQNFLSECGRM